MNLLDIIFIGIGLSMDACAVHMTNGLTSFEMNKYKAFFVALLFGLFQGLMPMIGYLSAGIFANIISGIAPYVALVLLCIIGINMIREAIQIKHNKNIEHKKIKINDIFMQAIATSIDAFAIGITLLATQKAGNLHLNIVTCVLIFAIITLFLSYLSFFLGKKLGNKLKDKAHFVGGIILIVIGIKIFIDGLI